MRERQPGHRAHDQARHWEHHGCGDESLQDAEHDLLQRDHAHRDGGEKPVVDLAREAEIRHHRQRHGLYTGERQRHRQDARQERRPVAAADESHPGQQVAEHHHEEQRLQTGADQEEGQLARGDVRIAPQERAEHAGCRHRGFAVHSSLLPVSETKSVSRLGGDRWTSRTARPFPSAARTSGPMASPARSA